jgi:hypothetical protein
VKFSGNFGLKKSFKEWFSVLRKNKGLAAEDQGEENSALTKGQKICADCCVSFAGLLGLFF